MGASVTSGPGRRAIAIGVVVVATAISGATPAVAAPAAKAEVKADWVAFFNGKTKAARRVTLLQDGKAFRAVIREASRNPLASTLSASVAKVKLTSKTKATVTYSLSAAGQRLLAHQKGTSIRQGGVWKVGDASFCSLLVLEQGGKKAGLPKACRAGK